MSAHNEQINGVSGAQILRALELAAAFVGKGCAEHAYDGCVVSGEDALGFIEQTFADLKKAK